MKWKKLGRIIKIDNNFDWMVSHSSVPVSQKLKDDVFRIYFATRDKDSHAQVACFDIDMNSIGDVLRLSKEPVLKKGGIGFFDDEGIVPSSFMNINGEEYLYYVGWNNHSVSNIFQTSIGISKKINNKFQKMFNGPILDRSVFDPTLIATFDILEEDGSFKMWYTSGIEWKEIDNKLQSFYHIKYAYSTDGIEWKREGKICIDFKSINETNIGKPTVIKENEVYKMWYCYASAKQSYRIGYAESLNGLDWIRKDNELGVDISKDGWDSEMVTYPEVFIHKEKIYMLYCGNGYGKEGCGLAVLEEE
jgi:hypothetical protein